MLFYPLGSKLKTETGYDIMEINLEEIIKEIKIPALFVVGTEDKISGTNQVKTLFENYGCNFDN